MSRFNKMCTVLRAAVCAVFVPFAALAYNVTYDCGDGTGTPPATDTTAVEGETFSPVMVLKNSCQKTGYVLSGWKISGTNSVVSGGFTWQYTEDKTFTAQWAEFDPKFTITTTNMPANSTFKYWQGANGLFYVDWGDGTLQTINGIRTIEHTYATAGVHTIRFDGLATGYRYIQPDYRMGSVSFGIRGNSMYDTSGSKYTGTPQFVAGISGSLGAIYPGLADSNQPRFIGTFSECTNLTGQIPANLFSGVVGSSVVPTTQRDDGMLMFAQTFYGCSGLTGSIPAGLFGDLNNAATDQAMFQETFRGCSGLTGSIPAGLFSGVTGIPRAGLFGGTFQDCSGLTGSIPAGLFSNISGDASTGGISGYTINGVTYTDGATQAFGSTFSGCSGLTGAIPQNLFAGISGSTEYLFNGTFNGCSNLTGSIPADLFANITGSADYMFAITFQRCEKLTGSIPENLFRGVSGSAPFMFSGTFSRCYELGGSIPAGLFSGVTGSAEALFQGTFNRCTGLTGTIPDNLFRGVSGGAKQMFQYTFGYDSGLTGSIPAGLFTGVSTAAESLFEGTFVGCTSLSGQIPNFFFNVSGAAPSMFNMTFKDCRGLTGQVPDALFASVSGAAKDMFKNTFSGACSLSENLPHNLFYRVSGSAQGLFHGTFDMSACGVGNIPASQLEGYIDQELFEHITANATDEFTDTFKNTALATECECGTRSATTAWGISFVDGRAVCYNRPKDNEVFYNGECVTTCSFATELKTENNLSYPLLSEQVTTPTLVFESEGTKCYVPLESGADSFNLKWQDAATNEIKLYHTGSLDDIMFPS